MDEVKAKAALKAAIGVLRGLGLVHFLDQGTLLGAVRGGRLIEWDEDVDLGLFLDGYEVAKLREILIKRGFKPVWYLTFGGGKSPQLAVEWDEIRVDFHCYEVDEAKGEVWHYAYIPLRKVAKNAFPMRLFDRFENVFIGTECYLAPSPVGEFLRMRYGDWEIPKQGWDYMREPPCVVEVYESKVERS